MLNTLHLNDYNAQNAFQNGIISQAARAIISLTDLDDLVSVITTTLESLSVAGLGKVSCLEYRKSFQFGKRISREQCKELSCYATCQQKILATDDFIVVKNKSVLLIVNTSNIGPMESDLLQDNLASFADIIQSWTDDHADRKKAELALQAERSAAATQLDNVAQRLDILGEQLVNDFNQSAENLMSKLMSLFPSIGLEPDQEEKILDSIATALNRQELAILAQIDYNKDARALLGAAGSALRKELHLIPTSSRVVNTIELF